jgi:ribosome hibernation promoting factor
MQVEIRARHGQLSPILEEQLERRLHFALARFGGRIRRTSVIIEDINGPRGGEDQHCKIEVTLVPSGVIMAEATDVEIEPAVGRAADRVARRVGDALDRKRTKRTRSGGLPIDDHANRDDHGDRADREDPQDH